MISAYLIAVIPALVLPWALLPLGNQLLFALLPVVPVAIVYAREIRYGQPRAAISIALLWALALTVSTIAAATVFPTAAARSIWHVTQFREEMLGWIATGHGAEGEIRIFLPRVLIEFVLLFALSALSQGTIGLFLGGVLLGYMNGYVGWVVSHADPATAPILTAATAWPPWSVCRVISFVLAGTAAALWGYRRIFARDAEAVPTRQIMIASLTLLLLDIGLKWWLAPIWRDLLRGLLGASAGIEAGGTG
ncbi:MAG: hypothetical protein ACRENN_02210 [Candidatus Eiseniibacteriota bacterium]